MSEHKATIRWDRASAEFTKGRYSREHTWSFDGGLTIPASPSPALVPAPYSNAANVDPEEAYVAAVSSCHMLTFLYLASKAGFRIDCYEDEAVGRMTKNASGVPWVSEIVLRPVVVYANERPSAAEEARLHHEAHAQCYISSSIKSAVSVRPRANRDGDVF